MTVDRFRDVADMPPPPRRDPSDPATYARIKMLWRSADRLPALFGPGVYRYRSIEASDAARERALIARMRAMRLTRSCSDTSADGNLPLVDPSAPLRELYRLADETRPPAPALYVRGKRSVVADLVAEVLLAPGLNTKHLLYGATGSGKSTQLRDVAAGLARAMTIVDVDFDRSGITVSGISAFDLAYVIGVKALAHLDQQRATPLFDELAEAYAEGDEADASALGRLDQALPGIAGFGDAVLAVAKEAGMTLLPGTAVVSGVKAAMNLLRLRTKKAGLVVETSPRGRRVQAVLEKIFAAVRAAYGGRPIAVLVDGLEKVNGGAGRWMRETFEYTRLLTDTSVTMVAATPSCPFSETNAALAAGWSPQVVYGFAPDDLDTLAEALSLRVRAAGIDPVPTGFGLICHRLASDAGGHPRHAMLMLRSTVMNALKAGRDTVVGDDVDGAVQKLREQLAMGLIESHYVALRKVEKTHRLPDDDVATSLFGDGRILVHPPTPMGPHRFHVHPLLQPWITAAEDVSADDR